MLDQMKRLMYNVRITLNEEGCVMLQGLPGINKCQAAFEYCKKHERNHVYFDCEYDYPILRQIAELPEDSFNEEFRKLCQVMDIKMIETVLIFDNIECSDFFCDKLFDLLRSRNYQIIMGFRVINHNVEKLIGKYKVFRADPYCFLDMLNYLKRMSYADMIHNHASIGNMVPDIFHRELLGECDSFIFAGGMPEIVRIFENGSNNSEDRVKEKQDLYIVYILEKLLEYSDLNESERRKCRLLVNGILKQMLTTEYSRFKYNEIRVGTSMYYFNDAIDFLCKNNFLIKIDSIDNERLYVLFFYDSGVLFRSLLQMSNKLGVKADFKKITRIIRRNFCVTELMASGVDVKFWRSNNEAYIDALFENEGKYYALQIMDDDKLRSRSLDSFLDYYSDACCFCVSEENFRKTEKKIILPLYSISCIKEIPMKYLFTRY